MQIRIGEMSVIVNNLNSVAHKVTAILRSEKAKISACATDGLFQSIRMLGNNFQMNALSPFFFFLFTLCFIFQKTIDQLQFWHTSNDFIKENVTVSVMLDQVAI